MELIVVTGLSGAGRHSVLGALEDTGCTALDNVPPRLLEPLLELEAKLQPRRERLIVGMDSRQADFAEEFGPLLDRLNASNVAVQAFHPPMMRSYVISLVLPFATWALLQGDMLHTYLGAGIAYTLAALFASEPEWHDGEIVYPR